MKQGVKPCQKTHETLSPDLMLCDAHTHPGTREEWMERQKRGILSLVCASSPSEAEELLSRPETSLSSPSSCLIPTIGLHPWHAAEYAVSDVSRYFSFCPAIGEIGMDSIWCKVPLSIQEAVFRRQLKLACDLKKPVILHTKGQEQAIFQILREYPNTFMVHWYSCGEYLEEYIKLGCYFSVGPDVWWNPAVQRVAETVPLDRLLIETDGMNAVRWAYSEAPEIPEEPEEIRKTQHTRLSRRPVPESVSAALASSLLYIAKLRHLTPEDAGALFRKNLLEGFFRILSCPTNKPPDPPLLQPL